MLDERMCMLRDLRVRRQLGLEGERRGCLRIALDHGHLGAVPDLGLIDPLQLGRRYRDKPAGLLGGPCTGCQPERNDETGNRARCNHGFSSVVAS